MISVVIVEDDPMVARINSQYIARFPELSVSAVFSNGSDAWDYIQKNEPDLLVLDIYMPGMSGLKVLHRIRSRNMKTEVIMVTAANELASVDAAMKLGIVDYLIKPFEYTRFSQAVGKFLQRKNLLQGENTLSQAAVDSLLLSTGTGPSPTESHVLHKGLNAKTARFVAQHLEARPGEQHTCESLSADLRLSKVTIRRYLNYFVETGNIVSTIDYETGGRPSVRYTLKHPFSDLF